MDDWLGALLLFVAGCVAGTINVIAGGGSFLTLPLLIFLGLPPNAANYTNRLGIFLQNIGAVWGFHRRSVMDWRFFRWAALPATLGGLVGAVGALLISDDAFRRVLAFLMVVVTLWPLWDPLKSRRTGAGPPDRVPVLPVAAAFFAVGIYGGFVQAGVGFFLLAAGTIAGLDLVRGNAVKVLCALSFTTVSLVLFAWQGTIYWREGLILAAGTLLGGQLGVRLTVLKGHAWVKGVVTVTVILFAVKLWLTG
jgi:uncharacterized membrane protein YfcA